MKKFVQKILFLLLIFLMFFLVSRNVSKAATNDYYITVNYGSNVVTVYTKDSNGNYTVPYKSMICSAGISTPKSGTYNLNSKYRWLSLVGGVYGQYCTRITGSILFHSVPYTQNGNPASLEYWEYDKLGSFASAGCIRLKVEDAKWIYENCSSGTQVTFFSSADEGPLGKPSAPKISNSDYRNWDPTDVNPNNPWIKLLQLTFNSKYYADNNSDLKSAFGYDENELRNHWINFGINEGREASPLFNVKYYLDNYSDLKMAFNNNYNLAIKHYIEYGINEGRSASKNFDISFYKYMNSDLKNMTDAEALNHYINFGINENRITYMPEGLENIMFNAKYYSEKYPDLKSAFKNNENLLKKHWYEFGIKEGRVASEVFNLKDYLNYNLDLKNEFKNNYEEAYKHFIRYGINEERRTTANFNIKVYKNENVDLLRTFGNDYIAYFNHYLIFGKNENRKSV